MIQFIKFVLISAFCLAPSLAYAENSTAQTLEEGTYQAVAWSNPNWETYDEMKVSVEGNQVTAKAVAGRIYCSFVGTFHNGRFVQTNEFGTFYCKLLAKDHVSAKFVYKDGKGGKGDGFFYLEMKKIVD